MKETDFSSRFRKMFFNPLAVTTFFLISPWTSPPIGRLTLSIWSTSENEVHHLTDLAGRIECMFQWVNSINSEHSTSDLKWHATGQISYDCLYSSFDFCLYPHWISWFDFNGHHAAYYQIPGSSYTSEINDFYLSDQNVVRINLITCQKAFEFIGEKVPHKRSEVFQWLWFPMVILSLMSMWAGCLGLFSQ